MDEWGESFGKEYTDRNYQTVEQMEGLYRSRYGVTRTEMNQEFVGGLDRSSRILEVGTNIGNQLLCLQRMGFRELYGIELQWYAVEQAKRGTERINIIQGSAFDIPFKDGFFDLVFTSGLLIHIAPSDIRHVLDEIHRCARRYVWGLEYFAEEYTTVKYRGHDDLLWKTDFCALYKAAFPALRIVKKVRYQYIGSDLLDSMFLLDKAGSR
jgi:pseudaminic acid biosynthesis-associated methylase